MKNFVNLILLACVTTLFAQQQTLPSAPDPKPSPSPFRLPAKAQPVPPAASAEDEKDNEKKHHKEVIPGIMGMVDLGDEILDPKQQTIFKEYLTNRLVPDMRGCWYDIIPEEALAKHRRFRFDKKGKSGKVQVAFTLHKDGSKSDTTIQDSSGDNVLDQAALNAVKDCRPSPLPSAFARETVKMRFSFYYNP